MKRPVVTLASIGALVASIALTTPTSAQPTYPMPGGAPGSDTGDGSGPFVGVAGAPDANLFTGAAGTRIAIEVPPGRRGATPRLDLVYSSAGSAGPYGMGWSLPLARVVRSTSHGVPEYTDDDTFVLELNGGSVELEPVAGTKRFAAKVEGAFVRIGFDPSANAWKAIDKSGTVFEFGTSADARIGADTAADSGTYAWLIQRSTDTFGNHIDYDYLDAPPGKSAPGLPSRISYGGNLGAGIAHVFTVDFLWTAPSYPSSPVASLRAGFPLERPQLLQRIETGAEGLLARRYEMNHQQDPVSATVTLSAVGLEGFADDPARDVSLPSTVFTYAPAVQLGWPIGAPAERNAHAIEFDSPGGFRRIGGAVKFDTFDLNGDSLVDYVDTRDNPPTVRLGTGLGFAPAQPWAWPSAPRRIRDIDSDGNLDVNVFDITGDGLPDLVDARQASCGLLTWCVYRNTGSGFETLPAFWPALNKHIRAVDGGGKKVRRDVVDLDADGRPDWIDATTYTAGNPYWDVYWNTGSGFDQAPTPFRAHRDLISETVDHGLRFRLSYGPHDMNGDGLPDFVEADLAGEPGYWNVYFNNGSGFASDAHPWRVEGAQGPELFDYISITDSDASSSETFFDLVDVTGDGLPDWLRHGSGADPDDLGPLQCDAASTCGGLEEPPDCCLDLLVFVNTGSSFAAPVAMPAWHESRLRSYSEIPSPTTREFEMFDFDGDGLIDLVEIEDGRWRVFRNPASPLASGTPTPDESRTRPGLMTAMLNGVGGETHLRYMPAALAAGNTLPFPRWTLSSRTLHDGINASPALAASYSYTGGLYDGDSREFRGFAAVTERDALGRTHVTEFHQDDRLKGLVARAVALGAPSCTPADPDDPDDPCSPWQHMLREDINGWLAAGPALLASRTSLPYFDGVAIPELARTASYVYDEYGNVASETMSSPSATSVTTETGYAYTVEDTGDSMPSRYLVDRPVRTVTRDDGHSTPLLEKRFVYDAAEPVTGELVEASACIEPTPVQCARWSTTAYGHDDLGNVERILGPRGSTTTMNYDSVQLYAATTRNSRGHTTTTARDRRTGRVATTIDPDGQQFETVHDGLGRPVSSWRDGFSGASPEIVTTYREGVPGVAPAFVLTEQHGHAPTATFFDGLGRRLATKTLVETATGTRTVVAGLRTYTPDGQLAAESVSFDAPSSDIDVLAATLADAPARTDYGHDPQGRLIETTLPDGSRTTRDTSTPGVEVTVHANLTAGGHPGTATVELVDGLGRTWRKDTCTAAPASPGATGCPAQSLVTRTELEYDGLDRPTRIVSDSQAATPSITTIAYDGLGNRTEVSDADTGAWSYTYTRDGLLRTATDGRGITLTNLYDRLGRLKKQKAGKFKSKYNYHRRPPGLARVRRIISKRGRAKVVKAFEYDGRGRLVDDELRIRADGPTRRHTFHYTYDNADRRLTVTYPTSDDRETQTVTTGYSTYGQPRTLEATTGVETRTLVENMEYDLYGNIERIDYGNGLSDRYTYAPADELARLVCMRTGPATAPTTACSNDPDDLSRARIDARDAAGNIIAIADELHPAGSALHGGEQFVYDSLGRVVLVLRGDGTSESFGYDSIGNLTLSNGTPIDYAPGAPHRPTSIGTSQVAHDGNGNRVVSGPWLYTYDELGRLTETHQSGTLRETNYYDEGRTRVARFGATDVTPRYYFGGFFELDGHTLIRHYRLGGRPIASDRILASPRMQLALATGAPRSTVTTAAGPSIRLSEASTMADAAGLALLIGALVALAFALRDRTQTSRVALMTAVVFTAATLPLPLAHHRGRATRHAHAQTIDSTIFFHSDHLGSPRLVTDMSGNVVEYRRYAAYGGLHALLDASGTPLASATSEISFAGHTSDADTGLLYMGARFYDPSSGLFLTADPQDQFASPYLYGGGNPINGVDPDGESLLGLIAAIITPILISASVTALISGIATVFQGGDFVDGLGAGFVAGAMAASMGTAVGGVNIAFQYAAGGAAFIDAAEAAAVAVEVSARASFTTSLTHTATTAGQLAGADADLQTGIGVATGLAASYAYDNYVIKDSGNPGGTSSSQRELAKAGAQRVNTTTGHTSITEEAAVGTGWENFSKQLTRYNTLEDGPDEFAGQVKALLNNQDHFGRLPATIKAINRDAVTAVVRNSAGEVISRVGTVESVGAATHFIQDHLTLGHMLPGASLFAGPIGTPIRFVVHQVFGGEVAFRDAQLRATRDLLRSVQPGTVT